MDTLTALFISTTIQFGLPSGLLNSLCFVESSHKVSAIHKDDGSSDSYGVCQIKLETARWLGFTGTAKELMQPKINIYYAGKYLAYQHKRYKNTTRAIIAYNMGSAKDLTNTTYSDKVIKQWGKANVSSSKTRSRQTTSIVYTQRSNVGDGTSLRLWGQEVWRWEFQKWFESFPATSRRNQAYLPAPRRGELGQ